ANEQALEPGKAINQTEADIADKPQNIRSVGEQAIETISGNAHRHRVEAPPPLIAFEHIDGSRIEPKARRVDDDLGERGDILESHIEALAGDRMDQMRGVTNERNALGDERAGDEKSERMYAPLADHFDLAEMQLEPLFELGIKFLFRQGHDALGLRRGFGPHD